MSKIPSISFWDLLSFGHMTQQQLYTVNIVGSFETCGVDIHVSIYNLSLSPLHVNA